MSTKKPKHIHKFKRYTNKKTGNSFYYCTLPDCEKKFIPALLLGKRSLCNRCDEPFILNDYSLRLVSPHCENCHESNEKKGRRQFVQKAKKDEEVPLLGLAERLKNLNKINENIKSEEKQIEEEEL